MMCFYKSWDIYHLSTGARFPLSSYLHRHRRSHQVWFPLEEPYRSLPRPTTFMNPGLPTLVCFMDFMGEGTTRSRCFIGFYRIKKVMDSINFFSSLVALLLHCTLLRVSHRLSSDMVKSWTGMYLVQDFRTIYGSQPASIMCTCSLGKTLFGDHPSGFGQRSFFRQNQTRATTKAAYCAGK